MAVDNESLRMPMVCVCGRLGRRLITAVSRVLDITQDVAPASTGRCCSGGKQTGNGPGLAVSRMALLGRRMLSLARSSPVTG